MSYVSIFVEELDVRVLMDNVMIGFQTEANMLSVVVEIKSNVKVRIGMDSLRRGVNPRILD